MNLNDMIHENKNYLLIFVLTTLMLTFTFFKAYNYSNPIKEIIILLITLIFGIISITFHSKYKETYKTAMLIILLFGLICLFISPLDCFTNNTPFKLNNWEIYLIRIFNLILYAGLCGIAIKQTPALKMPMLVIASFPLLIIHASCYTYDAFSFGFTLIAIAYFLHMYKSKNLTKRHILIFTLLIFVLGVNRIVFLNLILLTLLIPKENFKNEKDYRLGIISIAFIALCFISWFYLYIFSGKLNYLISNPQVFTTIGSLENQTYIHVNGLSLFYLDYDNFLLLSYAFITFYAMFTLFYPINEKISPNKRIIILLISLITIIEAHLIFFFIRVPVGLSKIINTSSLVMYYLPIISLFPLIFNINNKRIKNQDKIVICFIITLLSCSIMFITTLLY